MINMTKYVLFQTVYSYMIIKCYIEALKHSQLTMWGGLVGITAVL